MVIVALNNFSCRALAALLPFPSIRYSQLCLIILILISAHMGLMPLAIYKKLGCTLSAGFYFLLSRSVPHCNVALLLGASTSQTFTRQRIWAAVAAWGSFEKTISNRFF
jgi:vancomycin permeability regulator SanA